jgi:hypothetical protein
VGKDNGIWLIAIYLFLSIYLLPMFPHGGSANELTRWATAASLVEKGSFDISWTEPLIGPNVDTAKFADKTYSNKAPGTAVLAAPIYALTRLFIGPPDTSNIRVSWFVMRFFISTLPLLLLALWFYAREIDEMSLALLLFATPLFLYSLLFFSHVFVAIVIYFAFRAAFDQRYILPWHALISGLLCGVAVISEFTAVIPAAVFGVGLIFADKRERFKRPLFFLLGGLPFALLLAWYNSSLFGSVFSLSYAHESFPEWAEVAGHGVFGIGWPSLSNLYLLLLSPSRGLFFAAPIFLYSIFAFFTSRELGTVRHRVKVAAIIVTILVLSGHGAAHGGWAFGPRYLILIMPLMLDSFFDGEIYEMSNLWQGLWFGISLVFCTLPALTFPFAPPELSQPLRNFWLKFLTSENWYTPNFANVIGAPSSIWTMLPVFALLLLAAYIVLKNARRPRRFLTGLVSAAVITSVYLAFPTRSFNPENAFRRATIAERFFMPAGRLDQLKANAESSRDVGTLNRIRQAEWMIADTRAFAPNDWPYMQVSELPPSPTALMQRAANLQQQGKADEAADLLRSGIGHFDFARCGMTTNLAVVLYNAGDRDGALKELEKIQPLVTSTSSPDCLRSQYLLGSLLQENGDTNGAQSAYKLFINNSASSNDPQIQDLRRKLTTKP